MKQILVLRGGALGDFIVTLPVLQALRSRWPEARIEFVGNARAAELGREAELLDAVESQDLGAWHTLFTDRPAPALAQRLKRYDLVINFWPDPDGTLARHFRGHCAQTYLSGAALPECAPAAAHYCAVMAPLGVRCVSHHFGLRPWQPVPRRIAIHPGSGSAAKNWPLAHWRALAEWLRDTQACALHIVRGEAEAAETLANCGTAWNNLPLTRLADELSHCSLFIGHDSGVSHLAAACNCPGLLLFGPTNPEVWAPPYHRVRVLRAVERMADLSVATVQSAVAAMLVDQK